MGLLENAISEELPPMHSRGLGKRAEGPPDGVRKPQAKAQEKNKVIAAAVGATLTALTMTPFDVIKTRLQTQAPPEPLFVPSSHLPPPSARSSTSPWPPPVASTSTTVPQTTTGASSAPSSISKAATNAAACCQKTFFSSNVDQSLLCRFDPRLSTSSLPAAGSHPIAAPSSTLRTPPSSAFVHYLAPLSHAHAPVGAPLLSVAGSSATCVYPTSSAAILSLPSQSQPSSSRHLTGFWDAVTKIVKHEGVGAMWRGTGPALVMSIPGQVVYMVGYDWMRRTAFEHAPSAAYLSTSPGSPPSRELSSTYLTLIPLIAGSISRTIVAALTSPLELVRTRLQSSTTGTTIPAIYRSMRAEGLASAWKGLPPTLWRDVPFSGIYWAGYEGIKRTLTGGKGMGEGWQDQGVWEEFGIAFVSGAGSGMIAATLTNPFDVIKTRRQALDSSAPSSSGRGSRPAQQQQQLTKTFPILFDIFRQEGWQGLMRGLTPRLAKVGPACGLMIASYEGLSVLLDQPK